MRAPHLPLGHWDRREWLYLVAFILPPLAVKLTGEIRHLPANILLTLCFWLPGVAHAVWLVNHHSARVRESEAQLVAAMRNHIRR